MCYADDASLLYNAVTVEQVNSDFSHDERLLTLWFRSNYLHLKVDKCYYIIYSYKKNDLGR